MKKITNKILLLMLILYIGFFTVYAYTDTGLIINSIGMIIMFGIPATIGYFMTCEIKK